MSEPVRILAPDRWRRVVAAHRLNALLLSAFLTAHMINHAVAVLGPTAHGELMSVFRLGYRNAFVEPLLLALITGQVALGAALLVRRFREKDKTGWSWIQLVSGGYLALFLLNHVYLGILRARAAEGIETGFDFAAATVVVEPGAWFFRPYYALAVLALFAHLAAALHWRGAGRSVTWTLTASGAVLGAVAVAAYAGALFPLELPGAYLAYARNLF